MSNKAYVGWPSSPGNPGCRNFKKLGFTTKETVFNEEGNIYGLVLRNPNTTPVFLNFYAGAADRITVGAAANVPILRLMIPAALDASNPGQLIISPGPFPIEYFDGGCVIAPVTLDSDSSAAAPASGITAYIKYAI